MELALMMCAAVQNGIDPVICCSSTDHGDKRIKVEA